MRVRVAIAIAFAIAFAIAPLAHAQSSKPAPKPAKPATKSAPAPAKPAPTKVAPAKPVAGMPSLPGRRPIVLDPLHVEGKADAPRVLFVHAGPTVALEDAPAHPSYLRDDFTAALSSPVRVRVRAGELARPTTAGGNR